MIPADLRASATARSRHADRCEETASVLSARAGELDGMLDEVVALHTPSTWHSAAATAQREALGRYHRRLEASRVELRSVVRDLYDKADESRREAATIRRQADAAEVAFRQAQVRRAAELAVRSRGAPITPPTLDLSPPPAAPSPAAGPG